MQSRVPTNPVMLAQEGRMDKSVVGVDVSKEWLDIAVAGSMRTERIANTPEAVMALLDRLRPALVAFEPTAGTSGFCSGRCVRVGSCSSGCIPTTSSLSARAEAFEPRLIGSTLD